MLNSRKETQPLASAGSKILGLTTLVIEQGLKQRKHCSLIHFFNSVWKLIEWDAVNFIMNQFIMVIELSEEEFGLSKSNKRAAWVRFEITSMISDQNLDLVSSNIWLMQYFIHFLRGKNESFRNKSYKICHMILFVFQALKSDWLFCSYYSLLIGWEKDAI